MFINKYNANKITIKYDIQEVINFRKIPLKLNTINKKNDTKINEDFEYLKLICYYAILAANLIGKNEKNNNPSYDTKKGVTDMLFKFFKYKLMKYMVLKDNIYNYLEHKIQSIKNNGIQIKIVTMKLELKNVYFENIDLINKTKNLDDIMKLQLTN